MKRLCAALSLCIAGAGCGAGGTGNSGTPALPVQAASPTASPFPAPNRSLAKGIATIFIPDTAVSKTTSTSRTTYHGHARSRHWVSPSTQSISINATAADGFAGYVITAVPPNAPNCTAVTGGRNCTLGFKAPPGIDTVQIFAYDYTDAYTGSPLATATVPGVNVAAQGSNTFTFTLGGIVGRPPVLSPATFSVIQGTPADLTLSIVGEDFDGNPITKYDAPLAVSQSDNTGNFTLSKTSIADSSVTPSITVHYNGGLAATTITVSTTSQETANDYNKQSTAITIIPTPLTGLFVAAIAKGVNVYSTSTGALIGNFASSFGADSIAMDNAGDVFIAGTKNTIAKFAIGANTPTATYVPSAPSYGSLPYVLGSSEQGTLVAAYLERVNGAYSEVFDEWDQGVVGAPSRTISRSSTTSFIYQTPVFGTDGSLFIAYFNSDNSQTYDVIAPGSTTVSRTGSIPAGVSFANSAVGPDGTFYVAGNNRTGQDSSAGLYVFPPSASSYVIKNGAPLPTAIDTDDAGNVYVTNSNSTPSGSSSTDDTLHLYTVFAPGANSLIRQVRTGFSNPQAITVSGDGSLTYLLDFGSKTTSAAIVKLVPSSTTGATVAANTGANAVLFDGMRAKAIRSHGTSSAHGF